MIAPPRLLLLDVDHTLFDSPAVDGNDYPGWELRLAREPPDPVAGAVEGVAQLLAERPSAPVLVTARSSRLRVLTERSICQHFPMLVGTPLSMGLPTAGSGGTLHKIRRIEALIRAWPPDRVVIVDDDPAVASALGPESRVDFRQAPGCWMTRAKKRSGNVF